MLFLGVALAVIGAAWAGLSADPTLCGISGDITQLTYGEVASAGKQCEVDVTHNCEIVMAVYRAGDFVATNMNVDKKKKLVSSLVNSFILGEINVSDDFITDTVTKDSCEAELNVDKSATDEVIGAYYAEIIEGNPDLTLPNPNEFNAFIGKVVSFINADGDISIDQDDDTPVYKEPSLCGLYQMMYDINYMPALAAAFQELKELIKASTSAILGKFDQQ